ncbi:hypothetical protein SLNWT_4504 [Streptomyces albus]|uniref:Uncharacterized protein n=1 Tax=Streptomyces albus (strain ATCC 21838 / DSM 41398 / FERM P-419 / JCM 4703 / NBRC 107858) TaxID=1081613 RepID=A0A0B5EZW2_STRA4|nr:hypothetical protein SLNWT_4504 [Streptomyces albus]AOU79187.1 hypothetical protein SLNHY_4496 [Streptomyces albus]AYN34918.1 hypothetical protein DUI70_4421 [Streptomyces albus]
MRSGLPPSDQNGGRGASPLGSNLAYLCGMTQPGGAFRVP